MIFRLRHPKDHQGPRSPVTTTRRAPASRRTPHANHPKPGISHQNGTTPGPCAGVDIATIALWLGHSDVRATQIYLHADLAIKERALLRTTPPNIAPGRYRPPDPLLAFLEAL
jgi:integrase